MPHRPHQSALVSWAAPFRRAAAFQKTEKSRPHDTRAHARARMHARMQAYDLRTYAPMHACTCARTHLRAHVNSMSTAQHSTVQHSALHAMACRAFHGRQKCCFFQMISLDRRSTSDSWSATALSAPMPFLPRSRCASCGTCNSSSVTA